MDELRKPDHCSKLVRFDFQPGASPAEIAAAIEAARKKILAEKAKREQRNGGREQVDTLTRPASPPVGE